MRKPATRLFAIHCSLQASLLPHYSMLHKQECGYLQQCTSQNSFLLGQLMAFDRQMHIRGTSCAASAEFDYKLQGSSKFPRKFLPASFLITKWQELSHKIMEHFKSCLKTNIHVKWALPCCTVKLGGSFITQSILKKISLTAMEWCWATIWSTVTG